MRYNIQMLKLSLSLSLRCPFVIVDLLLHVLNDIIRFGPAYMKLKVQWSWLTVLKKCTTLFSRRPLPVPHVWGAGKGRRMKRGLYIAVASSSRLHWKGRAGGVATNNLSRHTLY